MKQSSRNRALLSRSADFLYSIEGNPLAKAYLDPEAAGRRRSSVMRSHRCIQPNDTRKNLLRSLHHSKSLRIQSQRVSFRADFVYLANDAPASSNYCLRLELAARETRAQLDTKTNSVPRCSLKATTCPFTVRCSGLTAWLPP